MTLSEQPKKLILLSLFAGFMIGVGCIVYLACENRLLGAFLFSAGLFFVLMNGGILFTGICGMRTPVKKLAIVFVLNGVGIFLAGMLVWPEEAVTQAAAALMTKKIGLSPLSWLANGFLCGVMMYLGVTGFRKGRDGALSGLSVLYAVPVFIIGMFEHSIADMGYLAMAIPALPSDQLLACAAMIVAVAVGNVLGSKAVRVCTE